MQSELSGVLASRVRSGPRKGERRPFPLKRLNSPSSRRQQAMRRLPEETLPFIEAGTEFRRIVR